MENATLDALQNEVEYYRENHRVVDEEIRTLISDNQSLSQQVGMLLKEKLDSSRQLPNHHDEQYKDINELRKQVSLITKERDSLHVLWQTSQKTIDALETELKTYQSYDNRSNWNTNEEKRDLELKLETALSDYLELELKYKELITQQSTLENNLQNKEIEIKSYKERGKELEAKLEEAKTILEEHKINLAVANKNYDNAKCQLALCQKECAAKTQKEAEAKAKVAEALQLYDVVSAQKNEAHKNIQEIKGEMAQIKQTLSNVRRDTEANYRKEIDTLKDKYNEKVADMLDHIRNLDNELVEKGLLLNKTLRENKILQTTIDNYLQQQNNNIKSVNPKLELAEQRLEAMFQELVTSERRNIQLVCEKQCLAIDIQRIQDIHTREAKRRDWEENILKTQCDELKVQVEHLQKSLEETHAMVNKLQKMISSRTELNQKIVSTKEEELIELNKHLQNQMELSKKWKESYMEMTEKLRQKLQNLHKENNELKARLKQPNKGLQDNDESSAS